MSSSEKLGDIAPAKPLKKPDQETDKDVWHLNLDQIESNSGQILEEVIAPIAEAKNSTHWFDERHVLYSKLRPYLNKVVVPHKYGVATTELVPMMPDPQKLKREYLAYYLKSDKFVQWVNGQVAGAKMPRVSMKVFWNHRIPLPPLPIQKKIASILDSADALKQKDKALIAKYDELSQSLFLDMFGDPFNNPKQWPIINLEQIIKEGPQNGLYKPNKDYGSGTPIIRIDSFFNNVVKTNKLKRVRISDKEKEKFEIFEGDFLINRVNSKTHLGKCGLMPEINESMVFESNMMRIQFDSNIIQACYALNILSSTYVKNQILNSAKDAVNQSSINQKDVKSFQIPLPSISLQNQFAERIKAIEQQKQQAQASLKKSEDLFNCLLQKAFKGELVT